MLFIRRVTYLILVTQNSSKTFMRVLSYQNPTFPHSHTHTPRTGGAVRRQKDIRLEATCPECPKEKKTYNQGIRRKVNDRTLLIKTTAFLE